MTGTINATLAAEDQCRLLEVIRLVSSNDTDSVLAQAIPNLSVAERGAITAHTRFAHAALAIFPATLNGLREELARNGLNPGPATPSVIVRDRMSRRHNIPIAALDVAILRAPLTDREGRLCEVEIFAMVTRSELSHVAVDERVNERESHVALTVSNPDPVVLTGLRATLAAHMSADGAGYNGYENSTVLYFRNGQHNTPALRRLELTCVGEFAEQVTTHQRESEPGRRLLRLLTGAWATQAIAAAVELRLPDHLDTTPDPVDLAPLTGANHDSLDRLLRYLAALGVVRTCAAGYTLTEMGELLRSDRDESMQALALMYGGPFYRSFGQLLDSVRTGEESYAKVFGTNHFLHMSDSPELATLFHQSMAASNMMFTDMIRVVDFPTGSTVVDVAGGNGELLSQILGAHPTVRGVLLDRAHALASAVVTLAPVADRCTLTEGDFFEDLPTTGDVYLLSRVLHDWDDARCAAILGRCADAMSDHAELLVIERLLPETADADSLAIPWDVHMLCNVGGRERTLSQYQNLLAAQGFELVESHPLQLDGFVLRARKAR